MTFQMLKYKTETVPTESATNESRNKHMADNQNTSLKADQKRVPRVDFLKRVGDLSSLLKVE
jgi:hypothetical protein